MELSELALRLLLLFLPGIICWQIVETLTVHRKRTPFETVIQSFLFGLSAYFASWILARLFGSLLNTIFHLHLPTSLVFLNALQDRNQSLSFGEIGFVCVVAFFQALLFSALQNRKAFHNAANALRIGKKSGELDVWGIVFNSTPIQFATVRDYRHDLIFDGWIEFFSDDAKTSELFLRDVAVYRNSTGNLMYTVGGVYVCIDPKEMGLEFRDLPLSPDFQPKPKEQNE